MCSIVNKQQPKVYRCSVWGLGIGALRSFLPFKGAAGNIEEEERLGGLAEASRGSKLRNLVAEGRGLKLCRRGA